MRVNVAYLKVLHGAGIVSGILASALGLYIASFSSVGGGLLVFSGGVILTAASSYGWEKMKGG